MTPSLTSATAMPSFVAILRAISLLCFATMQTTICFLLSFISPGLTKKIILKVNERTTMTQNPKFKYEDWGPTFMSWTFLKTVAKHAWISLGEEAFVSHKAPDSTVITMDKQRTTILNFLNGELSLQSYSLWPLRFCVVAASEFFIYFSR